MKAVKTAASMVGIGLLAALSASGVSARNDVDPEVLALREAAWRAYFAGDEKALQAMLPAEFIGISMNDVPFADLATTLQGAREFKQKGGRLVRLAFPETRGQRFGDVVVLYGRYEVVILGRVWWAGNTAVTARRWRCCDRSIARVEYAYGAYTMCRHTAPLIVAVLPSSLLHDLRYAVRALATGQASHGSRLPQSLCRSLAVEISGCRRTATSNDSAASRT